MGNTPSVYLSGLCRCVPAGEFDQLIGSQDQHSLLYEMCWLDGLLHTMQIFCYVLIQCRRFVPFHTAVFGCPATTRKP